MTIDDVWDTIEVHRLKSMVNDIWRDGEIIMISVKTPRTAKFMESLFSESIGEIVVTR